MLPAKLNTKSFESQALEVADILRALANEKRLMILCKLAVDGWDALSERKNWRIGVAVTSVCVIVLVTIAIIASRGTDAGKTSFWAHYLRDHLEAAFHCVRDAQTAEKHGVARLRHNALINLVPYPSCFGFPFQPLEHGGIPNLTSLRNLAVGRIARAVAIRNGDGYPGNNATQSPIRIPCKCD